MSTAVSAKSAVAHAGGLGGLAKASTTAQAKLKHLGTCPPKSCINPGGHHRDLVGVT